MTFEPSQARYTLPFAGKDYDVVGTFQLIADIEWELQDNIVSIATHSIDMPIRSMAKVLRVILASVGSNLSEKDIGELLVNKLGVGSDDYTVLALHVHVALRTFIAKPSDRDEVRERLGELMGNLKQAADSLGESTSKSA